MNKILIICLFATLNFNFVSANESKENSQITLTLKDLSATDSARLVFQIKKRIYKNLLAIDYFNKLINLVFEKERENYVEKIFEKSFLPLEEKFIELVEKIEEENGSQKTKQFIPKGAFINIALKAKALGSVGIKSDVQVFISMSPKIIINIENKEIKEINIATEHTGFSFIGSGKGTGYGLGSTLSMGAGLIWGKFNQAKDLARHSVIASSDLGGCIEGSIMTGLTSKKSITKNIYDSLKTFSKNYKLKNLYEQFKPEQFFTGLSMSLGASAGWDYSILSGKFKPVRWTNPMTKAVLKLSKLDSFTPSTDFQNTIKDIVYSRSLAPVL